MSPYNEFFIELHVIKLHKVDILGLLLCVCVWVCGQNEEAGKGHKLSYTSLTWKIKNMQCKGHSEPVIINAVIPAVSAEMLEITTDTSYTKNCPQRPLSGFFLRILCTSLSTFYKMPKNQTRIHCLELLNIMRS